jgi:hypothetical protein
MSRYSFGAQDVPDPLGEDVTALASGVRLTGSTDDANAEPWNDAAHSYSSGTEH